LRELGFAISERVPHETAPHAHDREYLRAKKERMGHELDRV
jgi:GTP cyclohydrolase II